MNSVTIRLQSDTVSVLMKKAQQGGLTLEAYLEHLAEQEAHIGNGIPEEEEESFDRPWRGILVLPRSQKKIFSRGLPLANSQLPKRSPSLNMKWHRAVSDDE